MILVNTNEMKPPIAPIALDYLAGALTEEGYEAQIADLCLADDAAQALRETLSSASLRAVGLTFRNSDDCFWPSAKSFVPRLIEVVRTIRTLTDAPIVVGGAGFSVFPSAILEVVGADYGIVGDGEEALIELLRAVEKGGDLEKVPGLTWRVSNGGRQAFIQNPPRWSPLRVSPARQWVDNRRYFLEGGQAGVETKRGCDQMCPYCADILSKGSRVRCRPPEEIAAEMENILRMGIDVLHLCDAEFNVPPEHAVAVCQEMIRRGLGERLRWYTYACISAFPEELARLMRSAGCVGINFGADSANAQMLATYGRRHRREEIADVVRRCHENGIRVMLDLLLGGPGETEATLRETVEFMRQTAPDCVGAALGVRVYPGTAFAARLEQERPLASNPHLRFASAPPGAPAGPDPLLRPVFYIDRALGEAPAELVRRLIGGDPRFFEPLDEQRPENYNYSDNQPLVEAIRRGARGAYWDILRQLR